MNILSYLKARFNERSTWAAIGVAVTGAAALASPYSWIVVGVGVVGALVPTGGSAGE